MSVEAFHRLLKVVYLESKHNRRIDHLLSVLLRIARDKVYDRLIKSEKGKSTHRISEINRRHRVAEDLIKANIAVVSMEQSLWEVCSSSQSNTKYVVRRLNENCDCKLRCASCAVCVHMYTCSCVDSAVHSTACKHTHVVHMRSCEGARGSAIEVSSSLLPENCTEEIQTLQHLSHTLQQQNPIGNVPINGLKLKFQGLIHQLDSLANDTTECDTLKAGIAHLTSAVGIMKSMKQAECRNSDKLTPAVSIAPNTNSECQPRFQSTKNCRKRRHSFGLTKPTVIQMEECKRTCSEQPVKVCAACFQEEDKDKSDEIHWIQCFNCLVWVHSTCIDIVPPQTIDSFVCHYCTLKT